MQDSIAKSVPTRVSVMAVGTCWGMIAELDGEVFGLKCLSENAAKAAKSRTLGRSDVVLLVCDLDQEGAIQRTEELAEIARSAGNSPFIGVFTPKGASPRRLPPPESLPASVDALFTVSDECLTSEDRVLLSSNNEAPIEELILRMVISDLSGKLLGRGPLSLDSRDLKDILCADGRKGGFWLGIGIDRGQGRAVKAARKALGALTNQGLDATRFGAVLVSITAGRDLTMDEFNAATNTITEALGDECNFILALGTDPQVEDLRAIVLARLPNDPICRTTRRFPALQLVR